MHEHVAGGFIDPDYLDDKWEKKIITRYMHGLRLHKPCAYNLLCNAIIYLLFYVIVPCNIPTMTFIHNYFIP